MLRNTLVAIGAITLVMALTACQSDEGVTGPVNTQETNPEYLQYDDPPPYDGYVYGFIYVDGEESNGCHVKLQRHYIGGPGVPPVWQTVDECWTGHDGAKGSYLVDSDELTETDDVRVQAWYWPYHVESEMWRWDPEEVKNLDLYIWTDD